MLVETLTVNNTTVRLEAADSLDFIATLESDSIDAVITDPPYAFPGGGFMGNSWDSFSSPRQFQEWCRMWAQECYRVLKPGGHLVAFSASRTYHRLASGIEDAGFEIRDSMLWMYGSAMPKSYNVARGIDKAGGVSPRQQARALKQMREEARMSREQVAEKIGCTPSSVRDWEEGRARRKGSPIEYLVPSPAYREKLDTLFGYTADERRRKEQSSRTDRRGDGTVYGLGHTGTDYEAGASTRAAEQWEGWGTTLKPGYEPAVVGRKPLEGTVVANVLTYGTGAINIDATRVPHINEEDLSESENKNRHAVFGTEPGRNKIYGDFSQTPVKDYTGGAGRWPANVALSHTLWCEPPAADGGEGRAEGGGSPDWLWAKCADDCPVKLLDRQSGVKPSVGAGASRFFPIFHYEGKATRAERPTYVDNDGQTVQHDTVKPLTLMRWLVRMFTQREGTVLDPFAGSGTTVEACLLENVNIIACEREPRYVPLIMQRVRRAEAALNRPCEDE